MLTEVHILHFLIQMFVLLVAARALGEVFRRFGQPSIIGELLAGILIGSTVLGTLMPEAHGWIFREGRVQASLLELVGFLGVLFLLLVAGMEVDLKIVRTQGKAAVLTGVLGLIVPFGLGLAFAAFLPESLHGAKADRGVFAVFFATAMSISAVPVIARILMDLRIFRTDLGLVIMASAMSNDILGWVIFSLVVGMMSGVGLQVGHVVQVLVMTLGFTAFCLTGGRWIVHRLIAWSQDRLPWPGGILTMAFSLALLCSAATQAMGIHAVFGAFLAGIMMGDSPLLRERTKEIIFSVTMSLFAPIFFGSVGLHVDFVRDFDWGVILGVLLVACAGKLIGCYIGARLGGMSKIDSRAVAYGMNARGAMEIILALVALRQEIISDRMFVALVVMAVVTSMISGPLLASCLRAKRQPAGATTPEPSFAAFVREVGAIPKEDAIRLLVSRVAARAKLTTLSLDEVIDAVLLREEMMTTAMKHGFALPHTTVEGLEKPLLGFGRSTEGLDFDSPDGELTHFVFLLLTPAADPEANLRIQAVIARIMKSARNRDQLYRAESLEELEEVLHATWEFDPSLPAQDAPSAA